MGVLEEIARLRVLLEQSDRKPRELWDIVLKIDAQISAQETSSTPISAAMRRLRWASSDLISQWNSGASASPASVLMAASVLATLIGRGAVDEKGWQLRL